MQLCEDADSNQLSIVLNYETVSNIKAYFTDGQSSIKVINIMSDKYIKYPGVDNPLVDADGNILNPNSIDIIPNAVLPPFEIKEIVSGNFQAGMVQYCYRLYNKHSQ
nr:MAG TPA: stabilization protein [Crassvirales sp.]